MAPPGELNLTPQLSLSPARDADSGAHDDANDDDCDEGAPQNQRAVGEGFIIWRSERNSPVDRAGGQRIEGVRGKSKTPASRPPPPLLLQTPKVAL